MSRARNIKPGFFTNADLLDCQPLARLLFAGLWCEADRRGILEDRPKTLKIKILPGDNCDVDVLLNELAGKGFVVRYQVGEFRGLYLPNFGKHQNPHIKEMPSTAPAPCQHSASTVQAPEQHDASPAESLLLIPDFGIKSPAGESGEESPPQPSIKPDPKPRAHRLPKDWAPDESAIQWAVDSTGLSPADVEAETEKFRDHFSGNGKAMTDWLATWRNWIRRSLDFRPTSPTPIRPKPPQLPPVMQPGHVPKDGGLAEWRNAGTSGGT